MNLQNLVAQLGSATNPMQLVLSMMTPQQKQMAQVFLNKPNREEALKDLMKENNVSQEQVDAVRKMFK